MGAARRFLESASPGWQVIAPPDGAPANGPYSPGLRAGNLLFVSGQIAVRADGVALADADLATQTRQCLANLRAVLAAAGATSAQVARVTVYLAEGESLVAFNSIYAEFFGGHRPARSMVPLGRFPGGFKVEIDAIAVLEGQA